MRPEILSPPEPIANQNETEIFQSKDEMNRSLSRLCYGDLYIIGRLWIETLKSVLVGAKIRLIPIVRAASPTLAPQRPPPMKYKDLPLYQSPHYDYKEYIADRQKRCPEAKTKMFQTFLYPYVQCYRKEAANTLCATKKNIEATCKDMCNSISTSEKDLKKFMRDPNNLTMRYAVVVAGGMTGYMIASSRGIPRRLFFTGLGLLSAGALCFPEETDERFRDFLYHTSNAFLYAFSFSMLRERLPCKKE